jgi:hypothetical protein
VNGFPSIADVDHRVAVNNLFDRIDALQDLLMCYRIGKQPTEQLHQRLQRTQNAEVIVRDMYRPMKT